MGKRRILSLDFIKAIAILAVVLGHIGSPCSNFIFTWHMPVFFFVSGILLYVKDLAAVGQHKGSWFSRKDFFYLGKFYIIFGVLGILAEYFKTILLGRPVLDLASAFWGLFFFMDMEHLQHYGFILWFLPALFWAKVFVRAGRSLMIGWLEIFWGCLLFLIALYAISVSAFGIRDGMLGCVWGMMGSVFWHYRMRCASFLQSRISLVLCGVLVFLVQVPRLDLAHYIVPSPLLNVAYSLLVILFLFMLGLQWEKGGNFVSWVEYLSRNSIYIMVLHVYTNNFADLLVNRYLYGFWEAKFALSLFFVLIVLCVFQRFHGYYIAVRGGRR